MVRILTLILTALAPQVLGAQDKATPVYYYNPSWSADGRTILFESTREGKYAIYTIGADGTNLKKLTSGAANDEQPAWSHDGKHVAFISDRAGHDVIYLMDADGTNQVPLTSSAASDFVPVFSPDDRWIRFSEQIDIKHVGSSVFVVRVDGTGLRRLSDSGMDAGDGQWSLSGGRMAFTQHPGGDLTYAQYSPALRERERKQDEIYVIQLSESHPVQLTRNDVRDCCIQWRADGKMLYFVSTRDSGSAVYSMKPDGSGVRRITDGTAVWRAGAKGLYVRSTRDGTAAIYAMDLNGANARRIADAATVPDVLPSPDNQKLAYTKSVAGVAGLYVFDLGSGVERAVISSAARP